MNHCSCTGKADKVEDHQVNMHKVAECCHADILTAFLVLENSDAFALSEDSNSGFLLL